MSRSRWTHTHLRPHGHHDLRDRPRPPWVSDSGPTVRAVMPISPQVPCSSTSAVAGLEDVTGDRLHLAATDLDLSIQGEVARVASLADIIRSKSAAGRAKELAALPDPHPLPRFARRRPRHRRLKATGTRPRSQAAWPRTTLNTTPASNGKRGRAQSVPDPCPMYWSMVVNDAYSWPALTCGDTETRSPQGAVETISQAENASSILVTRSARKPRSAGVRLAGLGRFGCVISYRGEDSARNRLHGKCSQLGRSGTRWARIGHDANIRYVAGIRTDP